MPKEYHQAAQPPSQPCQEGRHGVEPFVGRFKACHIRAVGHEEAFQAVPHQYALPLKMECSISLKIMFPVFSYNFRPFRELSA